MAAALHLGGTIFSKVSRGPDRPYFSALFAPIGASPVAVLQRGGCCSGLSRLYILCLDALGIRAAQLTLYHRSGEARHCLVELVVGKQRMLVDPLYGFQFRDFLGNPIGLDDLRAGSVPRFIPLPYSTAAAYPGNPYYDFEYRNSKTANRTKSTARRSVDRTLKLASGESVDRRRLPPRFEWPQVILAAGLMLSIAFYDFILVAFGP